MSTKKLLVANLFTKKKKEITQQLLKHYFFCNKTTRRGKEDEVKEDEQIIKCTDHSMEIYCANILLEYKNQCDPEYTT